MKKNFIILFLLLAVGAGLIYFYTHRNRDNKDFIVLFGNVDVRQVDLGFRVSGRVINMAFEEGDLVKKDTYMGELDIQPYEDLVTQARAAIESNKVSFENAEKVLKRRLELINDGSVAQEELETAQSTRDVYAATLKEAMASLGVALTNLGDTKLYAPNEGTILTRVREPGTVVRAADPIYTLSLLDPVWVRAYIPEKYLGVVYPGMRAEIFTDTPEGSIYQGHVGFISPVAEFTPKTVETTQLRTNLVYRLRIIADNPDKGLRQGMPVTARLYLNSQRTVPNDLELQHTFIHESKEIQ